MNPDEFATNPDATLAKQFVGLPPEIQKALASEEVVNSLQEIGRAHDLHLDQVGLLLDAVTETFLGKLRPEDFSGRISRRLDISGEKAANITNEVNARVFGAIRDALKKVYPEPSVTEGHPEIKEEAPRPSAASALSQVTASAPSIPEEPKKPIDPYREPME